MASSWPAWEASCSSRKTRISGQEVVLAKPMTYMNESGLAVQQAEPHVRLRP